MLKYYRKGKESGQKEEITYQKALDIVLSSYRDNDMSRDMLTLPNRIMCRYSEVIVEDDQGNGNIRVLMAGLCNMLPDDVEYNDDGMRLERA